MSVPPLCAHMCVCVFEGERREEFPFISLHLFNQCCPLMAVMKSILRLQVGGETESNWKGNKADI